MIGMTAKQDARIPAHVAAVVTVRALADGIGGEISHGHAVGKILFPKALFLDRFLLEQKTPHVDAPAGYHKLDSG
jgi:hypothetical protein